MIPYGGTIVRPGVIAWDSMLSSGTASDSYSCEAVEQAIMAAMGEPAPDEEERLDDLLAELDRARVWLPLPEGRKSVTDESAVVLPVISSQEGDGFAPAFTSVQRLGAWSDPRTRRSDPAAISGPVRAGDPAVAQGIASGTGLIRHAVVPFPGLASLLPAGLGIAINPGTGVGLWLYPDAVEALRY